MGPTKDQSKSNKSSNNSKIRSGEPNLDSTQLAFGQLVEIVAALRSPNGCPWDKEQTHKSLCQFAIEEAYELAEAIESEESNELREELGDFLFQVILHAQIAEEENRFSIKDVIEVLNEKMRRRHPHVFAETENKSDPVADPKSLEQIWLKWEQTKQQENLSKGKTKPIFSYPKSLPALQAAQKIGTKTEGYKFDWDSAQGALQHLESEIAELKIAMQDPQNIYAIEHEMGDVLFTAAQLSRHLKCEPEQTLRIANRRFEGRFILMLKLSGLEKEAYRALPPDEKEKLWTQAKNQLEEK